MASDSAKTWVRRDRRRVKAGALRKKKESKKSTPSYAELFGPFGEPGQPAPGKA